MTSTSTDTLRHALEYASYGWHVVPVYGLNGDACQCAKGKDCPSPGKHPRISEWQSHATADEAVIEGWLDRWPESNIGLRMGPESGIVDIEFDSDEGRAMAERVLGECYTPTFASARSVHRLFRWSAELPRATVPKIKGLECRLGQSDKGAQSVAPPSRHRSGVLYRWLPGLSPAEVPLADIPAELLAMLVNYDAAAPLPTAPQRSAQVAAVWQARTLGEGHRNQSMYVLACSEWRKTVKANGRRAADDLETQAAVFDAVAGQNLLKCRPALDDGELRLLVESARQFISKQAATDGHGRLESLIAWGLEFRDEEFWPGEWRCHVLDGDPPAVHLYAPAWEGRCIQLSMDEFDDAKQVHLAVCKQTSGRVYLAAKPGEWQAIWNGRLARKDTPACRGLASKLLDAAQHTEAAHERRRHVVLAEFVMRQFDKASILRDGADPAAEMRPVKTPGGEMLFRFSYLMKELAMLRSDITRNELSVFLRGVGMADHFTNGTKRVRMSKLHPAAVQSIGAILNDP